MKLVLFDIDGTLIWAFGAGLRSLQEAFGEVFDRPDVARDLSPPWFSGRNDVWIFRELALAAGISPADYERRYDEFEAAYLDRLRSNMAGWKGRKVLPGVRELLDDLGRDGRRGSVGIGLVTGNLEGGARIKLAALGLDGYFETGGYGSDAAERSEIAVIARRRFEKLRDTTIPPGRTVLVGDTVHDVAAARDCGYHCVAVATGTTPDDELRDAGARIVLPDLSDPGPLLELL